MSAEVLRQAAALMRERAEAALVEPWRNDGGKVTADVAGYGVAAICHTVRKSDAEHIASWHPAVALAVADWMEGVAERHAPVDNAWNVGQPCCETCGLDLEGDDLGHCADFDDALAVARAYIGSDQ